MARTLDQILQQRRHRISPKARAAYGLCAALGHLIIGATMWTGPALFASPPRPCEAVTVSVLSPRALGVTDPTPPPPPTQEPESKQPEPPPPEPPPPEPTPTPEPDVPVLPAKKPKPTPEKPAQAPPPPPRRITSTPPPPAAPTRRRGSPFGKPLGSTSENTAIGVEDPNFTYGYYLDRVAALIRQNWTRPAVGSDIKEAAFNFRIQRDGTITALRLVQPSGSEIFDRAAQRAVEAASPLPPLPTGYKKDSLGINLLVD